MGSSSFGTTQMKHLKLKSTNEDEAASCGPYAKGLNLLKEFQSGLVSGICRLPTPLLSQNTQRSPKPRELGSSAFLDLKSQMVAELRPSDSTDD